MTVRTRSLALVLLALAAAPAAAQATWTVREARPGGPPGPVAATTNEEGYSLEIYTDAGAIRSRFTLNGPLHRLQGCPTWQVDQGPPVNRSFDGTPCTDGGGHAEFVLGRIEGGRVVSPVLLALMDGNNLTWRFRLANGDYRETNISLRGSKRSMSAVIGEQVTLQAR